MEKEVIKIILTIGIPASSKSTWARAWVAEDPVSRVRINNDDLRAMTNGSIYNGEYEKLIIATRNFLITEAIRHGKSVVVDNLNINKRHFKDICAIAQKVNRDIEVFEKHFYVPLEEAVLRDEKREGSTKVGRAVIEKWWKDSGKEQFRFYKPKHEVFTKRTCALDRPWTPMEQDKALPRAAVFDNDGSISLIHPGRSPYDASTCNQDFPHEHVIECMRLYHNAGYKILFVSGREEKDREPTERFYKQHFPEVEYELYMRPTGNQEKDVVIKERIFNEHIKGKYFVAAWFDDRLQIVKWLWENGFPVFRCNDPEATF